MRRLLCLLLVCMLLCLTACSGKNGPVEKSLSKHNPSSERNDDASDNKPPKEDETAPTEEATVPEQPAPQPSNNAPYQSILETLIDAHPWSLDTAYENFPDMSYLYGFHSALSEIGYAFVDVDGNGQDELVLTSMDYPFVYDLFTVKNGKAVHLFSSGERYRHSLLGNGYVQEDWSNSAFTSGHDFFRIDNGALLFYERVVYDAYYAETIGLIASLDDAEGNCHFRSSTPDEEDYVSISSQEADERIAYYENQGAPLNIVLTPLSEYVPS